MGKTRPIALRTRTFSKSGDATAFFSAMLQRYLIGQRLSSSDEADILALIERHDERDYKVGVGVSYIEVAHSPSPYENERCFWIVRTDGSRVDISYKHCLQKKPLD